MAFRETLVTRERVIAPPERFCSVPDDELIKYFQGVFGADLAPALPIVHQMVAGICTADFTALRRRLQQDYEYFGAAAEVRSDVEIKAAGDLDKQELRFLSDFAQLMEASQYRMLSKAEWDAAMAEDFLFTLPCDVKWGHMDTQMLQRYWAAYPSERERVPEATADHIMVFQRGTEVATMQGSYYLLKVNLIISMWILQPLYRLFVAIMHKLGVTKFLPDAPKGLAAAAELDPTAQAVLEAAAKGRLHPASTSIERRTFARVFPDGMSVVRQFFKKVRLQEACFRDVVILYRKAVPDTLGPATEVEIIKEADPKFMQRNIVLKHFRGIPMADLEMVMPEKKVFVPPKVFIEMAVTLIGGMVAMVSAMKGGKADGPFNLMRAWTGLSIFGGRAAQVYTSAHSQKILIEHAMGQLLYERTLSSGEGLLTELVDGVCRQRVREILVCYCILLNSPKPLNASELDQACEHFLATKFGCKIDFCCEEALPALLKWGLAAEVGNGSDGSLAAVPLPEALSRLDDVWDSIHDFKGGAKTILQAAASQAGGAVTAAAAVAGSAKAVGGVALGRTLSKPRERAAAGSSPATSSGSGSGKTGATSGGRQKKSFNSKLKEFFF